MRLCYNDHAMNKDESAHTPEIGFNLASALPRVIIPGQVEALTERLSEDGYEFASALPLRNIVDEKGDIKGCRLPIWYLEDAWNPTQSAGIAGLMEVVRGIATKDPLAPQIHDFIAFPDKEKADDELKRMVERLELEGNPPTVVVHHLSGIEEFKWGSGPTIDTILEINPGMLANQGEILTVDALLEELSYPASSRVSGVDLDTRHIRRNLRPDEVAKTVSLPGTPTRTSLGAWENTIQQFVAHTSLVDFQGTSPEEVFQTVAGKNTELNQIVRYVKDTGYKGPIRVEFNLGLANQIKPGIVEDVAKDVYEYLAETMK